MPLTLATSWAVRAAAAEPVAVVRVRNLQAVTEAASDAWGRPSKPQPLLISAEISFSQPFTTAAAQDCLTAETVHYGTLSRAILNALEGSTLMLSANQVGLHRIVHDIWLHLTGQHLSTGQESTTEGHLLSAEVRNGIQFLSITATLPKASLLGTGVSFTASAAFNARMYSTELRLHELRVPTLVGMNDNERLAKQFIVITVALDMLRDIPGDFYVEAEALVVKTLEESSFETLEALGAHIADCLLRSYDSNALFNTLAPKGRLCWQAKIKMEKPTAVPLADCPVVELRASLQ